MNGRETIAALPHGVRIGPFDIKIERFSVHEANSTRFWGLFLPASHTIKLQDEMPSSMQAVTTFFHEITHAIWWAYCIEDGDNEERTVSIMATGMAALHRDNPWLAPWIAKALK